MYFQSLKRNDEHTTSIRCIFYSPVVGFAAQRAPFFKLANTQNGGLRACPVPPSIRFLHVQMPPGEIYDVCLEKIHEKSQFREKSANQQSRVGQRIKEFLLCK